MKSHIRAPLNIGLHYPEMPQRLAVVISHPIQYYAPWFRHLAKETWLNLRVFYMSQHGIQPTRDEQFNDTFAWDTDLLSDYASEFVPNRARCPSVTRFTGLHNPELRSALDKFQPHAILLFGYAYRTHLSLLARPPAPIIFRGDSHLLNGGASLGLKRWILRAIYRRCRAFLPVGQANALYFSYFGVSEDRLFYAPHCVDSDHFKCSKTNRYAADKVRAELGIPEDAPVAIFSGKFLPKKRPDLLLGAFLRADVENAHLVFAGDGELASSLRHSASGNCRVHFLPFANQSAMPARYLVGDVFVLPSQGRHETWGLAVNEAMHLGLPCIVSDHVGCQLDLVPSSWDETKNTGWSFKAGDEAALASRLRTALTMGRTDLARIGRRAQDHAANFNFAAASFGLRRALDHITNNG